MSNIFIYDNLEFDYAGQPIMFQARKQQLKNEVAFLIISDHPLLTGFFGEYFMFTSIHPLDDWNYKDGRECSVEGYTQKKWELYKLITTALLEHFYKLELE